MRLRLQQLPLLGQLQQWLSMSDPLYSLVLFHSSFNLIGLCIFLPMLRPYTHWIEARNIQSTRAGSRRPRFPMAGPVETNALVEDALVSVPTHLVSSRV